MKPESWQTEEMNGKNPHNVQIYSFKFIQSGCSQRKANTYAGVHCAPRSDSKKAEERIRGMATPGQSKDIHRCFLHLCAGSFLDICAQPQLQTFPKEYPNLQKFVAHRFLWIFLMFLHLIFLMLFFFFFLSWIYLVQVVFEVVIFGLHNNPQPRDPQLNHTLLEEPSFLFCSEPVSFTFHFILHSSCLEKRVNKLLAW